MKAVRCSRTRKAWILYGFYAVCAVLLSSCSLFQSKPAPTAKCKVPTKAEPGKPILPYCSVNFDFPLKAVCSPKLYVYKNNRRLLLVQDGVLVRDYLIGLGPSPSGDKKVMGDGKTPEGEFFICVKNPASQFYKSLGISYPAPKHAEQALLQGTISPDDFQNIVRAFERKSAPPWNTPLGGAIFIHGGGGHTDWTKGCIAVGNTAMDELFQVIAVGTPVEIYP